MIADVAEYSAYLDPEEQDAMMTVVVSMGVSGLWQASFLKGLNSLTDAFMGDDPGSRRKIGLLQDVASQMTPFGSLLNFIDKTAVDPYKRAYRGVTDKEFWENGVEGAWGQLMAKFVDRLPGVSGAPTMYDQIAGEPVLTYPGNGPHGLNPLQVAIPILPRGIPQADRTWTNVLKFMGQYTEYTPSQVKLTNAEQQTLNKTMAQVRINGMTFKQWIDKFFQRADVQGFMDKGPALVSSDPIRFALQDEFNRMRRAYGQLALTQMIGQSANLQRRFTKKELFDEFVKRNDRDAARQLLTEIDDLEAESRRNPIDFLAQ
jgi:hypothetical protein